MADAQRERDVQPGAQVQRHVPRLLPPDISHFTDRTAELGLLDSLLSAGDSGPSAVVISAIAGTAGMGKTSLAVRWAHRVHDQFPDGQLYVNLRGYDPGSPVTPEQALDGFLRALDVPGPAIPQGVDAMAGYYRSMLAGRRMLVVLDNAFSANQARPLLPASPSCVVLVTSRNRLSGLIAREGASRITLDLLPADEAMLLLRGIIGGDRIDRESDAAAELARCCAYLPLALRIAAERVTAHPLRRIADLVSDLTDECARLDALSADDDEVTEVRAVFSWSYRALHPDAARLFRLLGLHPGPEVGIPAAAALLAATPATARRLLDMLASVHLLEEVGPSRYGFHDLLRAYAADRAASEETPADLHDATARILGWYLHSAHAASRLVWPNQPEKPIGSPDPDCQPLAHPSPEEAQRWLDDEHPNLMATIQHAAATRWLVVAWQLPLVLVDFFIQGSRWADLLTTQQIGLTAARQAQDQEAEYWALTCLGEAYGELERYDEAIPYAHDALARTRAIGNRRGEGVALHDLGWVCGGMGRLDEAASHLREALVIYREIGDRRGEGIALCLAGDVLRKLGRTDEALDQASQGIAVLRGIDNRWSEATGLLWLGYIYRDLLRVDDAVATMRQAQAIYQERNDQSRVAWTLRGLGEIYHQAGRLDQARQCWNEAVAIFDELNPPKAISLRERLDALGPATPA